MAHENLKPYLVGDPGKSFVVSLTHHVYPWSAKISTDYIVYRIFEEVTIREDAESTTRLGLEYRPHFRFDCVFFVAPGYRSLNQRQVYTIGVELKNSKADLMADDKMQHYLGYTDFFFIGVPSDLMAAAVDKAHQDPTEHTGVYLVDTGEIVMYPSRQVPTANAQRDLLEQIMYGHLFNNDLSNCVSVKPIDIVVSRPVFTPASDHRTLGAGTDTRPDEGHDTHENPPAISANSRQKEKERQERHDAKVAALQAELSAQNAEIPDAIVSMLDGLPLGTQRVYHAIRRAGGVQAQSIASILPSQEGVETPSLATVKRSVKTLVAAGLIERDGSRKTGQYVAKQIDCRTDGCQVCAKSQLCPHYLHPDD